MKVYEFAKEVGLETLQLMEKIRKWGDLQVKSHMSQLDSVTMDQIRARLKLKSPQEKKKDTKVTRKKAKKTKKIVSKKAKPLKKGKEKDSSSGSSISSPIKSSKNLVKKSKTSPVNLSTSKGKNGEAETQPVREKRRVIRRVAVHTPEAKKTREQEYHKSKELKSVTLSEVSSSLPSETSSSSPSQKPETSTKLSDINSSFQKSSSLTSSPFPPHTEGQKKLTSSSLSEEEKEKSTSSVKVLRKSFPPPPPQASVEAETKGEEKRKKITKESESQSFLASEFRKREVIFQPKKKKSVILKEAKKNVITTPALHKRVIKIYNKIKVKNLAQQMGIQVQKLIKKLKLEGMEKMQVDSNLDFETAALIASEFNFEVQNLYRSTDELIEDSAFGDLEAESLSRPPVVTVMGHVDHGKTTLLDVIRSSNAAKTEAGGITQHIGAYSVALPNKKQVTFIDTPGHEAFTALRARGAHITDIVLLVVAANDGVMPQTIEAIHHAQAAHVPIIVVINKIDLPGVNKDNIQQQLTKYDLIPEEWGGNTIFCEISALKKKGIKELLEQIHVVAEIQDLKANYKRSAKGIVIESSQKKGYGYVATVLVQEGSLKKGDFYVSGTKTGRIRNMLTDKHRSIKEVTPGLPVEILGLSEILEAGDTFDVCRTEAVAKTIAASRKEGEKEEQRKEEDKKSKSQASLEHLFAKMQNKDEVTELGFILKSDVKGSVEAIDVLLSKLDVKEVKIKVIHSAVGGINESDILLSSTTGAIIIGFNVRPDAKAQKLAQQKSVEIKTYKVIYQLIDDIKDLIRGKIKPEWVEEVRGRLEVRETFHISKVGLVAGGLVSEGQISRNDLVRLLREGKIVYEGRISNLKRFKEDVREVKNNFECGLSIENFNDIKIGDEIEAFIKKEVKKENIFLETN